MSQLEYTTPLFIHEDGTLAVHGGDIRGLVIEAGTLDELRSELRRVAPRLLRSNHGLTDDEIAQASLRLVLRGAEDAEGMVARWTRNPSLLSLPGCSGKTTRVSRRWRARRSWQGMRDVLSLA